MRAYAAVLLVLLGVAAGVWWQAGGLPEAAGSLAPADRLQRDLLRRNLGLPGDPALTSLYAGLNARHFNGQLPVIPVRWEDELSRVGEMTGGSFTLEGMFGHEGGQSAILLTPALAGDAAALARVLSHEMVHVYLHTVGRSSNGHGPEFQTVLHRLSVEGAFEGLVATTEERDEMRAFLDRESARLDAEARALEALNAQLQRERDDLDRAMAAVSMAPTAELVEDVTIMRDGYNARVVDANARVSQLNRDREAFLRAVDRYNLMLVYPDGLAGEIFTASMAGLPAGD